MAVCDPPTGNEKPQKHYGSPYLDEIDDFKAAINAVAANGGTVDTTDVHPLVIGVVAPQLLNEKQKGEVALATYSENNPDLDSPEGKTYMESNNDKEVRVDAGVDIQQQEQKDHQTLAELLDAQSETIDSDSDFDDTETK